MWPTKGKALGTFHSQRRLFLSSLAPFWHSQSTCDRPLALDYTFLVVPTPAQALQGGELSSRSDHVGVDSSNPWLLPCSQKFASICIAPSALKHLYEGSMAGDGLGPLVWQ